MTTIAYTDSERRARIILFIVEPAVLAAVITAIYLAKVFLFYWALPLVPLLLYVSLRNIVLLPRIHWMKDIYNVDGEHIEKILPDGTVQQGLWCDLAADTRIDLRRWKGLRSWLCDIVFGRIAMELRFANGVVITIPMLEARFGRKIFVGLALNGPLGNPLLVEWRNTIACRQAAQRSANENAFFRWCVISQLGSLGWLIVAYGMYFGLGAPWRFFIICNGIAALLSPMFLVAVYIYFRIAGHPGLFVMNCE